MRTRWIAVLLAAGMVMTACSGDDADMATGGSADTDSNYDDGIERAVGDGATADPASGAGGGDGEAAETLSVGAPLGRKVIRNASMTLEVDEPAETVAAVTRLVEGAGGFVAGTDLHDEGPDGRLSGTLTVRVPTSALSTTLAGLRDLAVRVPSESLSTDDVTEEYADIEAQLRNLRAYETELLALLSDIRERTDSADEVLAIFSRVREVRSEIERLQGRQQVLDDLVDLATVHVSIRPTSAAIALGEDAWRPGETVREALGTTVGALQGVADGMIWLTLTAAPIAMVVLGPVALLGWLLWRRFRAPRTTSAGSAG